LPASNRLAWRIDPFRQEGGAARFSPAYRRKKTARLTRWRFFYMKAASRFQRWQ
jgi:hypothetical protein